MLKKITLFLFIIFNIGHLHAKIAVGCMFQNEAPYLKEWIEYHRLVGVKHFYLWNNLSEDDYLTVLQPYIKAGIVEVFQAEEVITNVYQQIDVQAKYMNQAIEKARGSYEWLAMIDSDEFIVPMQKMTLDEVLEEYKEFSGLSIQWICFGTSNVKVIPKNKLMIEVLTHRAPYTHWLCGPEKFIVKVDAVKTVITPHLVIYNEGIAVYENKTEVIPPDHGWNVDPVTGPQKIRLNHYWLRDEEYYQRIKLPRAHKWGEDRVKWLTECKTLLNSEEDHSIDRFIKPLRKKIFKKQK